MKHNENTHPDSHIHKGFDIDELRYRRALALAKYEIAKDRLLIATDDLKQNLPSLRPSGLMGKLLGNLNFIDYALIAYRIFSKVRKFRRK